MNSETTHIPHIPATPNSIQKGTPLKYILGSEAIDCLAHNILAVYPQFDERAFRRVSLAGLEPLGIMGRGQHLARALRPCLPDKYEKAIEILLASLTPPQAKTEGLGLAVLFYLPYSCFVSSYGLDPNHNGGEDPFEISMKAQYELTKRSTSEFSIRPFLIQQQDRTLSRLMDWIADSDPHIRRLCSEGTRPRLPWAPRIPAFIENPTPALPILEALKNDQSLYVRRSVANHLGDIAKNHPEMVFDICERWLNGASKEVKWLIRHALRHPAKKENRTAIRLRGAAK